jgi:hypothetical protein
MDASASVGFPRPAPHRDHYLLTDSSQLICKWIVPTEISTTISRSNVLPQNHLRWDYWHCFVLSSASEILQVCSLLTSLRLEYPSDSSSRNNGSTIKYHSCLNLSLSLLELRAWLLRLRPPTMVWVPTGSYACCAHTPTPLSVTLCSPALPSNTKHHLSKWWRLKVLATSHLLAMATSQKSQTFEYLSPRFWLGEIVIELRKIWVWLLWISIQLSSEAQFWISHSLIIDCIPYNDGLHLPNEIQLENFLH